MRDEIDGRIWDAHGHAFSETLDKVLRSAGTALAKLHRLAWEASWRRARAPRHRAGQA
jgi:hypothetical protein